MIRVERGFPGADRPIAARLFWEAFKGKLSLPMGPEAKALAFIEGQLRPQFSFSAYDGDRLVGLVGFKSDEGGLLGGDYRDMAAVYGYVGAIWRSVILSMFERKLEDGHLLLDGIFVARSARGKGVGTLLLAAIEDFARFELRTEIRLDVIDTNPKAKALYERKGYVASGQVKSRLLKPILGFSSATTMILTL